MKRVGIACYNIYQVLDVGQTHLAAR